MNRYLLILLVTVATVVSGCKYQKRSSVFYNYEVECNGTGRQGSTQLKVWSYAKNYDRAVELAKKHAVHALIFKGVGAGTGGCNNRPMCTDPNAERQHALYFENFFSDNGKYLNFVSLSNDGTVDPNDRIRVGKEYKIGVSVFVMHSELRKELESAGIVKPLSSGF